MVSTGVNCQEPSGVPYLITLSKHMWRDESLVSLQLALAPVMAFLMGIKRHYDVSIQCSHDANARQQRWPVVLGNKYQRCHGRLPFRGVVLGLRQRHDVASGILQGEKAPAIGKRNRIVKRPGPGQ
jgi:hypothetical protein